VVIPQFGAQGNTVRVAERRWRFQTQLNSGLRGDAGPAALLSVVVTQQCRRSPCPASPSSWRCDGLGTGTVVHADISVRLIVMEYHPDGNLAHRRDRFRGDAVGAIRALQGVVQAVAELHAGGVVRRDLKRTTSLSPPNYE
jgi:hypothetical protein